MRIAPLASVALLAACTGDLSIVEAENDPPAISLVTDQTSYLQGESVTLTADVRDDNTAWDLLVVSLDVERAELTGPVEVEERAGLWEWTFPADRSATTVTVTATDDEEASATQSLTLDVDDNTSPTIAFDLPAADARIALGSTVTVEVTVSDLEDAEQDLALTWAGVDDLSMAPANPDASGFASFTLVVLVEGVYSLQATVTDSGGLQVTRSRTFTIVDPDADGDGDPSVEFGGTDCDDEDASRSGIAAEICDDMDNDCNSLVDDDATDAPTWYDDNDVDGYGDPATATAACEAPAGFIGTSGDCDDTTNAVFPGNPEVCDGLDNDCANGIDDGLNSSLWYLDSDGDTWGTGTAVAACVAPPQHVDRPGDCDDTNINVNPNGTEVCNGLDDDCANGPDDGLPVTAYYPDGDGDDYGVTGGRQDLCADPGAGFVTASGDCNDGNPAINPGALEFPADGTDQDCNGTELCYVDADNDGQRPDATSTITSNDLDCTGAGEADGTEPATDCNDSVASIYDGAPEVVDDGIDQNCDNGDLCYVDADGDGYRPNSTSTVGSADLDCADLGEAGSAVPVGDCDDNPLACGVDCNEGFTVDACDGNSYNNDCDGSVDEDAPTWYLDDDQDGANVDNVGQQACEAPGANWGPDTSASVDCNDSDPAAKVLADFYPDCDGDAVHDDLPVNACGVLGANADFNCNDGGNPDGGWDTVAGTDCDDENAAFSDGDQFWVVDCDGDGAFQDTPAVNACTRADALDDTSECIGNDNGNRPYDVDTALPAVADCDDFDADLNLDDGDNDTFDTCEGDCDDGDGDIFPNATEACNGIDDDCDNSTDEGLPVTAYYPDGDGDDYGVTGGRQNLCADPGAGFVTASGDCNDGNPAINPGAIEFPADGTDQDCNGTELCYVDADNDGQRPDATSTVTSNDLDCTDPGEADGTEPATDCNDSVASIYDGAPEVVDDGIDQDCDNGDLCYVDADGDGYRPNSTSTVGSADLDCTDPGEGERTDPTGDCNDNNPDIRPNATETVDDGVDQDCNGEELCYVDNDDDGYRPNTTSTTASTDLDCRDPGEAEAGDPATDCNDNNENVFAGAPEVIADGVDQDCNGGDTCYVDNDDDGARPNTTSTMESNDLDCTDPGEATGTDPAGDCNDSNPDIGPGENEIVADGVDQDCDGKELCYLDADGDGFRPDGTSTVESTDADCEDFGEAIETDPTGDCDDNAAAVKPGATEIIGDGRDQDCDGTEICFLDNDDDGYRPDTTSTIPSLGNLTCTDSREALLTDPTTDCDDNDAAIRPGLSDICDDKDNDCDNIVDEDALEQTWYLDGDGDNYGLSTDSLVDCAQPLNYVLDRTDCNDGDIDVNPGAEEICDDGIDNDCVGGDEVCGGAGYSGTWQLDTNIIQSCAYNTFASTYYINYAFSTVEIVDSFPNITVITPKLPDYFSPDRQVGTFDTPTTWTANEYFPPGNDPFFGPGAYPSETYEWLESGGTPISYAVFTSPTRFEARFTATFSTGCTFCSCIDQTYDVVGTKL